MFAGWLDPSNRTETNRKIHGFLLHFFNNTFGSRSLLLTQAGHGPFPSWYLPETEWLIACQGPSPWHPPNSRGGGIATTLLNNPPK